MDTPPPTLHLSAQQAAAELGVSVATLYAYVSRGLIRSEPRPGTRARLYRAEDVRALAHRGGDAETGRENRADRALSGGGPVLDSALTLITDGRLYYRGRDAVGLATSATLETVATRLWFGDGEAPDPFAATLVRVDTTAGFEARELPPLARAQLRLAVAAALDPAARRSTREGMAASGARILYLLADALAGPQASPAEPGRPIHLHLAAAWGLGEAEADLLRAALVLAADHELNASTFAVRVAASTGATPHQAVQAGLATLSGPRHGGLAERAAALMAQLAAADDPVRAAADLVARGDPSPGFGLPLYPAGDPRGRDLVGRIGAALGRRDRVARALSGLRAVEAATGEQATIDAGLGLLVLGLGLPPGSALGLFALARTAGWIGHYMEQRSAGGLIRPRARYVGLHPG